MVGQESSAAGQEVQGQGWRVYVVKESQKSLFKWTKQKWRTKSGKRSSDTGERYLPEKAIKALSPQEYAATTRAKRKGGGVGSSVPQPDKIASKVRKYRNA